MSNKIDTMKKDRTVYNRGEMWFTKWKSMPKNIMGKFQDSREDPRQVYRLMKMAIVDEPERIDHEKIVKIIKRYLEALPEDMEMTVPRNYLNMRLQELHQMSKKDNYTKAELLRIAATCLSPEDASAADIKMNKQNKELKEYAESKVQQAVLKNLKRTTTKPEDQWIDNPNNRKRQFVHSLVVENKPLPKVMIKNDFTAHRGRGSGRGRGFGQRKRGQGSNRTFGGQSTFKNEQNDYNRNRGRGRGGRGRGRGGRAPRAAHAESTKENVEPTTRESKVSNKPSKIPPYDMSKIPQKLEHFGDVCEEVHRQLQDQLIHKNINADI